eukprot:9705156-Alexandrium_andersonii.AAC.1
MATQHVEVVGGRRYAMAMQTVPITLCTWPGELAIACARVVMCVGVHVHAACLSMTLCVCARAHA